MMIDRPPELEVDGFRLDISLPDVNALAAIEMPPQLMAASKLSYLYDSLRADPYLPNDLNGFQRDWLFQFLLSALLADAGLLVAQSRLSPLISSTRIDSRACFTE
jgi:hypothetical protein